MGIGRARGKSELVHHRHSLINHVMPRRRSTRYGRVAYSEESARASLGTCPGSSPRRGLYTGVELSGSQPCSRQEKEGTIPTFRNPALGQHAFMTFLFCHDGFAGTYRDFCQLTTLCTPLGQQCAGAIHMPSDTNANDRRSFSRPNIQSYAIPSCPGVRICLGTVRTSLF